MFPVILFALISVAFYSGIEIAYLSSNKFKIELDNKQGQISARIIAFFVKSPSKFIATVLVGLNVSLVIYGTYMAELLKPLIHHYLPATYSSEYWVLLIETFITTLFLLLAGEFLPKILFSINPNQTLSFFSVLVLVSYIILYPAVWVILKLTHFILRKVFKIDFTEDAPTFGRLDLDHYIADISSKVSSKSEHNKEIKMFQKALDFENLKIRQCMIPRTEIVAINVTESITSLKAKFVETGFAKILVYRDNPDNIIGFVHSYEMYKRPADIQSVVLPVSVFPEPLAAKDLLTHFTENHRSVALVVDEFGMTSGMVTVEDIIEEIFGEINDEHDIEELVEGKIGNNEYVFSGRLEIDYINNKYHLDIPEHEEYTTLAGFIFHNHENIPTPKEEIKIAPFVITVQIVLGNRIEQVKLRVVKEET